MIDELSDMYSGKSGTIRHVFIFAEYNFLYNQTAAINGRCIEYKIKVSPDETLIFLSLLKSVKNLKKCLNPNKLTNPKPIISAPFSIFSEWLGKKNDLN